MGGTLDLSFIAICLIAEAVFVVTGFTQIYDKSLAYALLLFGSKLMILLLKNGPIIFFSWKMD